MRTETITVTPQSNAADTVRRAAEVLNDGGLVAFRTETVYGLGVRADIPKAVDRLRAAKGRAAEKAFTVHIAVREDARKFVNKATGVSERLMRKGWPGPLTLLLPVDDPSRTEVVSALGGSVASAIYYDGTVGLRCPDDPLATALILAVDGPVIASSANRGGNAPPVDATDVRRDLDGEIDLLVDGGSTRYARASTIVRVRDHTYEVLREGVLDTRMIDQIATLRLLFVCTGNTCRSPMAAGIARQMIAKRLGCSDRDLAQRGILVESAGTSAEFGWAAENAIAVLGKRGIDLSDHEPSQLRSDAIQHADSVFVMTRAHRRAVLDMVPSAESRVHLLLENEDLEDPVGKEVEQYEACASRIEQGLEARLREMDL